MYAKKLREKNYTFFLNKSYTFMRKKKKNIQRKKYIFYQKVIHLQEEKHKSITKNHTFT